jgi:hypothetical protein
VRLRKISPSNKASTDNLFAGRSALAQVLSAPTEQDEEEQEEDEEEDDDVDSDEEQESATYVLLRVP